MILLFLFIVVLIIIILRCIIWCTHGLNRDSFYDVEQPEPPSYEVDSLPTYYELYELGLPSYEEAIWGLPSYHMAVRTSPANNNNFIEKLIDEILIVVITTQQ